MNIDVVQYFIYHLLLVIYLNFVFILKTIGLNQFFSMRT